MYELKTHLYKRGIFKFGHLEIYKDSIETWKVWNFWYMLVVAEHELIEIEKLYAIAQGIPMDDRSKIISKISLKNENKISSDNFKNKLQQWRIMFYWKQFFDIDVEELRAISKNNLGKLTPPFLGNLYLQIRIFDFITPMKLNDFSKSQKSEPDGMFQINRMRVHYFFTSEKDVMKSFFNNTEIELRITVGMNWNKPVAIASSFALQYFKLKGPSDSHDGEQLLVQRQELLLHFFVPKSTSEDTKKFITNFQMQMTVGIKEDLKIKTENIMLYRFNDVFFPDNSYYNSDPLPVEWIEVFQEGSAQLKNRKQNKRKSSIKKTSHSNSRRPEQSDGDLSFNGAKHDSIKKTLKIYSAISNVNKDMLKDDISGIDEDKPNSSQDNFMLAIEPAKPTPPPMEVGIHMIEEEQESQISEDQKFAKVLATVEEDEKNLDDKLKVLNKREKMISQLQSSVSKNSYRKWEKQAAQFKEENTKELEGFAYNKNKSIKTRIQMYKNFKNLKNGKIRLGVSCMVML